MRFDMRHTRLTRHVRRTGVRLAAVVLAATLGACNTDELLEVQTPDQITPDKVNSPSGALALRAGAIRDFYSFFNSNVENLVLVGGMLTDELIKNSDCVFICTDHSTVDYHRVCELAGLIVDTRNALNEDVRNGSKAKLIRL